MDLHVTDLIDWVSLLGDLSLRLVELPTGDFNVAKPSTGHHLELTLTVMLLL